MARVGPLEPWEQTGSGTRSLGMDLKGRNRALVPALPGQEEWPGTHIDILIVAGQAAAVLLQVVPGVLVEVGHLVGKGAQ